MKLNKDILKRLINEEVQGALQEYSAGRIFTKMRTTVQELLGGDQEITLEYHQQGIFIFTFCGIRGRARTKEQAIENCLSEINKLIMKSVSPE
jgi:hypothetical protein